MKPRWIAPISIVAFLTLQLFIPANAADILYIGDSHSYGCFGETFENSLREITDPVTKLNLAVSTTATCASSLGSWLESSGHSTSCGFRSCDTDRKCRKQKKGHSESLDSQLKKEKPRLTIVALGTNSLRVKNETAMSEAAQLTRKIKAAGSECVWIGPPQPALFFLSAQKYETFNQNLRFAVEANGCRFISSSDKTARENLKDKKGLHYDCSRATDWAVKVAAESAPIAKDLLSQQRGAARGSTSRPVKK